MDKPNKKDKSIDDAALKMLAAVLREKYKDVLDEKIPDNILKLLDEVDDTAPAQNVRKSGTSPETH